MDSPSLTLNEIQIFCSEQYGISVTSCQKLHSLLDSNYLLELQNVREDQDAISKSKIRMVNNFKSPVILKVSSGEVNFDAKHTDVELLVTQHLIGEGFVCSQFLPQQTGEFYSSIERTSEKSSEKEKLYLRLLTYIPGSNLKEFLPQLDAPRILRDMGELVAELHSTLKTFEEKQCVSLPPYPEDPWHLENMSLLKRFLPYYRGEALACLEAIIDKFVNKVIPQSDSLSKGMIHADIHAMNIIVNFADADIQVLDFTCSFDNTKTRSDVKNKYGVIDFSDMAYSCHVFEIGQVIRKFMQDIPTLDPLHIAGYFLSGYLRHRKLTKEETDLLPDCISGALCQYIIIQDRDLRKQPDNDDIRTKTKTAWSQLLKVKSVSRLDFYNIWSSILQQDGLNEDDRFVMEN